MFPIVTKQVLDSIDTFLFDCDGVLWHADECIPGVAETLQLLKDAGKQLLFVTNNSTKSRQTYLRKFQRLQLPVESENEIFGSSYAAAFYLRHHSQFPADKKVYVVGQRGITDELESEGIRWCGATAVEECRSIDERSLIEQIQPDPEVGAVLVGFDIDLNYRKLAQAATHLRYNPGCLFYATNTDATYPLNGRLFPGTGTMVRALQTAVGREPDLVFGKPNQLLLRCIEEKFHLDAERCCMVGDRLDTDIAFGQAGGMKTLLVLSGVTQPKDLDGLDALKRPDYCLPDLSHLRQILL